PAHLRGPARALGQLGALAVTTEIFGWMVRNPETRLARALAKPGHELQHRLATAEPTPERTARDRLPPEVFDLPVEKMRAGYYTDAYFNHTRETLLEDARRPRVVMQVFQKKQSCLGGMDEAIAIVKLCSHD